MLIVGGGLAGAGLAIPLAEAGWRVTLVEREAGPHDKVCGEFLSREAMLYSLPWASIRARWGRCRSRVSASPAGAATRRSICPFAAASLSRRVLDEALLARAAASGVSVLRGRRVMALEPGFAARLDDGTHLSAPRWRSRPASMTCAAIAGRRGGRTIWLGSSDTSA